MSFKTTYILFGILAAMLGFLVLALIFGPAAPAGVWLFPSLHREKATADIKDVTRVEVNRGNDRLVFERDANSKQWKMTQPHELGVDQAAVNSLATEVLNATATEKRLFSKDLADLGLQNPKCTVTIHKGNDDYKLNLGDKSAGGADALIYVTSSERKEPLGVRAPNLDLAFRGVNAFRSRIVLADSAEQIGYLKIQKGSGEPIVLKRLQEKGEGHWVIVEPVRFKGEANPGGEAAATPGAKPTLGVKDILNLLTALRIHDDADFVEDNVSDKNLAEKYKLGPEDKDVLRVEVRRSGDDQAEGPTLFVGAPAEQAPPAAGKPGDESKKYYVRLKNVAGESDHNVIRVADAAPARPDVNLGALSLLAATPGELRDRQLLRRDLQRADALNITNAKGSYRLRNFQVASARPTPGATADWRLYRGDSPARPERTDARSVGMLLRQLESARIEVFLEDKPPVDKPLVALWANGFPQTKQADAADPSKPPVPDTEPKLDKPDNPDVELAFATPGPDDQLAIVRRKTADGETWVKVPVAVWRSVAEGPLYFLDRKLPSFSDRQPPLDAWQDVTRLEIQRAGTDYVLERDKEMKDGKPVWKFSQPAEFKDRQADADIISGLVATLNSFPATTLVVEQPADADLDAKYGLKTPRLKFKVTFIKGDKTETREYLFDDTKDKDTLYGKIADKPLIFTVDKQILTIFDKELLDPVILNVKADDITGLKLTGWSKRYDGQPATIEMDRQAADKWALKGTQPFELDPEKVESFVRANLVHLQVQRFLTKIDPKPDDKIFDVKNNALEITVLLKDGKPSFVLTIARDGDKAPLYGKSNQAPGIFVLPEKTDKEKDRSFQAILEGGRGYFGKLK